MTKTTYLKLMAGCAFSALALVSAPQVAAAQDQGAARVNELEEVMVTARRREENIQDVPAAVTALGAQALER
jgi:iron complex outermembrane receptor protein